MELPTIQPLPVPGGPTRPLANRDHRFDAAWHALRIALLVVLLIGLHRLSVSRRATMSTAPIDNAELLKEVQQDLPLAAGLRGLAESAVLEIVDAQEMVIGTLATTSPKADSVVGYSGPNNVLLILSNDQIVVASRLLSSGDTLDHVGLVAGSAHFWEQFVGRRWGSDNNHQWSKVDGVSGATLTSLAIAEAIALRMSGQRLNLRFPESPTLAEAQALVSETMELVACAWHGQDAWQALDASGQALGTIVRTGNLVDSLEGYQGPSELLLWFDNDEILRNIKLRSSFDNQPYVGYVQQEYSFWPLFKKRSLESLANIDLEAEKIEGVSGATMTSVAVAQTVQQAADRLLEKSTSDAFGTIDTQGTRVWNWSRTEIATAILALASIPFSRWRMRGHRGPRLLWQVVCVLVLGVAAGNLLSIALFAGWTRGGIPTHLAPGLATLLTVALVWPAVGKNNVYCDQLCPHGIIQQWMLPWQRSAKRTAKSVGPGSLKRIWLVRGLRWTSYGGLLAAFGWIVFEWPIALAMLEPFDAYAWRIGWSLSCVVWIASLLLAMWRPMAYCQLACPTGRALDILRRSRRGRTSWLVEGVLIVALGVVWMSSN